MTLVILTGAIDLSVGSLVALAAVIRHSSSAIDCPSEARKRDDERRNPESGDHEAREGPHGRARGDPGERGQHHGRRPCLDPFAWRHEIPDSFTWLGRETGFLFTPNAVLLLVAVYSIAHVLLACTRFGRYVYAVGGNAEAALLSGVRVKLVLVLVYTLSGAMSGLGAVHFGS